MRRETIGKACGAAALAVCAFLGLGGLVTGKPLWYHLQNRGDLGPLTREDIVYLETEAPEASSPDGVVSAQEWSSVYPEISVTMGEMDQNSYQVDYLEESPYLVDLYEGYGFAKDYKGAIGHTYTLRDVAATERPHPLANCLTCKSPNFTKLVNDQGEGVYSMDFEEVYPQLAENISCYNCHGNNAGNSGQLEVTHEYLAKALGKNMDSIDPAVLSCGQCHMEYYFAPDTKATSYIASSVEEMAPEAMLASYNEMDFTDWTQESTGTKMLKAQHPEMETFLQGKHAGLLNCADCHMPLIQTEEGKVYHSHNFVSPLKDKDLLAGCAVCHGDTDMVNLVNGIQERTTARETQVGEKLAAFKAALAGAVSEGALPEDKLEEARRIHREAQWYFDYCYVENSEGAHNSELAMRCLDTCEEMTAQGMELLGVEQGT